MLSLALATLFATGASAATNPKRGLAFADGSFPQDINQANQTGTVLSWVYDWGTTPASYLAQSGLEYVPMQWGGGGVESFESAVLAQGAKYALAFNEPDNAGQANLAAWQAAQLYQQYIQPLASQGVLLGAPAVTNGPNGTTWLADFLDLCVGCTIDFVPLHWYGDDSSGNGGLGPFYNYIWSFHGQFPDYPLWITEFATTDSDTTTIETFLNGSIAYLDTLDWVDRYAWFALFREGQGGDYALLDANGILNELGDMYVLEETFTNF